MELIDRRALPWERQELDQDGNWTLKVEYIEAAPHHRCRACGQVPGVQAVGYRRRQLRKRRWAKRDVHEIL